MVYRLKQTAISFETAKLQTSKMVDEEASELLTYDETWWSGWMSAQKPQSGAGRRETDVWAISGRNVKESGQGIDIEISKSTTPTQFLRHLQTPLQYFRNLKMASKGPKHVVSIAEYTISFEQVVFPTKFSFN